LVISFADGGTLTLSGVTSDEVTWDDFLF